MEAEFTVKGWSHMGDPAWSLDPNGEDSLTSNLKGMAELHEECEIEVPGREHVLVWMSFRVLEGHTDVEVRAELEKSWLFTGDEGSSSPWSLTTGFWLPGAAEENHGDLGYVFASGVCFS